MATAYIGIGSNLEDPCLQVNTAILNLDKLPHSNLISQSSIYSSKPQGPQDQPDFVNAVAKITTTLSPLELLSSLQKQEQAQGKIKLRHWGERLIDLDILLFDNVEINSEKLTIPHSQMHLRDFVLLPLAEIEPNIEILATPINQLIDQLTETYI